jgi:TonB family protein
MKTTLLFIGLIVNTVFLGFAQKQLSAGYKIQDFDKHIRCNLVFYQGGSYELLLEENVSPDIIYSVSVSLGTYTIKNNVITLTDQIHAFQMQMQLLKSGAIIAKKGFAFIANKTFVYSWAANGETSPSELNSVKQYNDRTKYLQTHTTPESLYYGQYGGLSYYLLDLQKDNRYTLHYKNILISIGTWEKSGNELALYDTSLQHKFYLMIEKNKLVSKYIPGDERGIVLDRIIGRQISPQNLNDYQPSDNIPSYKPIDSNEPFAFSKIPPSFNGGETALSRYIKKNIVYPDAAKKAGTKGNVILRFVVEKDGSLSQIKVAKSLSKECDAEAIRLVKAMPKWIPGKHDGKTVAVYYTLGVSF